MNFFENKRAVALTGVFALAFIGTVSFTFTKKTELAEKCVKIEANNKQINGLTKAETTPTAESIKPIEEGKKELAALATGLKNEQKVYAKTCQNIVQSASQFTPQHIRTARKWLVELSEANQPAGKVCEIPNKDKFCFGLDNTFENSDLNCNKQYAPHQIFQLNAARTLAGYAVEAGATKIDRMFCETVRTDAVGKEYEENLINESELQWPYTPIHIELSFTAPRPAADADSALTKVLNSIVEGKGSIITDDANKAKNGQKYLFVIKAVNVVANNNLKRKEALEAPTAVNGENTTPAAYEVTQQKTGFANDSIRVNLVVEAVYFPHRTKEN